MGPLVAEGRLNPTVSLEKFDNILINDPLMMNYNYERHRQNFVDNKQQQQPKQDNSAEDIDIPYDLFRPFLSERGFELKDILVDYEKDVITMKLAILKPPKYVEAKAKKGNWFRKLLRL